MVTCHEPHLVGEPFRCDLELFVKQHGHSNRGAGRNREEKG
jgi:hypothetical protein